MSVYRKAWFFVKSYKKRIGIMLVTLVIAQLMVTTIPLITKNLLDNYIVGLTLPWSEVATNNDEKTIEYEGSFYKQDRYLDEDDEVLGSASVIIEEGEYYLINGTNDDNLTVDELADSVIHELDADDIQLFYSPMYKEIILFVTLLFTAFLIQLVSMYFQRIISSFVVANVTRDARLMAMEKINYIKLSQLEEQPAGKLANRVIGDAMGMGQLVTTLVNSYFTAIISITFTLIAMFILVPEVGIFLFILVPFIYFWVILFNKKVNSVAKKINETNSLMIARINEIINGINILKVFNTKQKTLDDFEQLNDKFVEESIEESKLHQRVGWNGIYQVQGILSGVVVVIFTMLNLYNIIKVEPGLILAYFTYTSSLFAPIIVLFQQFGIIEHAKVKTERYYKIIHSELEDDEFKEIPVANGDIEFKNVNFAYIEDVLILKNINLQIKAQQKIGLVGHTGSGKSTMMNLLMRFNDIEYGEILVDGESINKHSKRTFRQNVGIILQEPVLFNTTLRENLLFGSEMDDDKLVEIMEQVGGKFILDKFDNGLDEIIAPRGGNMSLGEKQLISFARILIKNPPIIIMDEATANIDIETELMIQNALKVASENRTLIIIAHRLSTIVDCDKIVVLNQGEIIEQGTHNELIKNDDYYANMYRSQVS